MRFFRMGLSGYLSSGAELGNMTGKAILSLLGTLIEEVGIFARGKYNNFKIEEMIKKALVVAVMLLAAMSARAQIGYKGQVALGVSGGISNVGGFVSTVRIDSYLSERSILGAGIILDRTRYDATQGDSFHTSQWLGVLHYRYAIPLGRFIVSPTGGVLLGGEQCDQRSRQGNILPYGNQFVYGLMLQCDVEYVLGRHWAIALEPRMTYLIKTQFDNVKMMANIGLKYYF